MTKLEKAVANSTKLRPRTKELYLQHVRTFIAFAGSAISNWKPEKVVAWMNDMRKREIRAQSVNVALNALRYAAQQAKRPEIVRDVERLPIQGRRPTPVRALTWDEGKRLVAACNAKGDYGVRGRDHRDRAIITLGLRTGMLRFSMCQLQFEDVETAKKVTRITFTKKGGERHTITLDKVTQAALDEWLTWLVDHGIQDGHVFRSLGRQRVHRGDEQIVGDQLTPDGLYRALRDRAISANLLNLRPHVFRKTFLTWAKKAGAAPSQIEAVTGHKSDGTSIDGDNKETGNTTPANLLLPPWDGDLGK